MSKRFYGSKDIRGAYISTRKAAQVARELEALGYDMTVKECNEYAMNVVARACGAHQDQAQEVYAVIHSILSPEDYFNYTEDASYYDALPGYIC